MSTQLQTWHPVYQYVLKAQWFRPRHVSIVQRERMRLLQVPRRALPVLPVPIALLARPRVSGTVQLVAMAARLVLHVPLAHRRHQDPLLLIHIVLLPALQLPHARVHAR